MKKNSTFFKIWLLLFFLLFCTGNLQAQGQNIIIVNNAVGFPDSTVAISVEIQNEDPFFISQFQIPLPEGFNYVENSTIIDPPDIQATVSSIGSIMSFFLLSTIGNIYDGALITFTLNTPSQTGIYPINIENAVISDISGENIITGVVNGTVTIAETGAGNILILHDATGLPDSSVVIDIEIQNEDEFVGFQFDIIFPEGFQYVHNSLVVNPSRVADHCITATFLWNIVRFTAWSPSNSAFLGNAGTIASFTLTTPSVPGTYGIEMFDPLILDADGQNIITASSNGVVTITQDFLPGDANCDGTVNIQDVVVIISYILGTNPQPFCFENADVNHDGLINVNDVVGTVSIILGEF